MALLRSCDPRTGAGRSRTGRLGGCRWGGGQLQCHAARHRLFTSESVTEGHPDKVADQISDAVLDAVLSKDPLGRVACETALSTGTVLVFGEITTEAYVDIAGLVRQTIKEIGYTRAKYGIDWETCGVLVGDRRAVAGHLAGRQPRRRRRPGNDVRLRLRRDPGADAGADPDGPSARPPARGRCAATGPCAGRAPTARPRSRSNTTARDVRAVSTPSWSASSTARRSPRSRSSRTSSTTSSRR